ncbi:MAG: homogentisate 1,2-dioxygenase [Bdellovibrionia bacterium]
MFQYSQGRHTTQGHKGIPENHFEEEQGRKGFFGPVSHLIKPKPSTRWVQVEGPLRPHLYDVVEMPKQFGEWQRLMYNSDVALYNFWVKSGDGSEKKAIRNADGDTLYFVHKGEGVVLTEYGSLAFNAGTYINMPKSLHHTFVVEGEAQFLVIESLSGTYREPERGMVGRNAFYDQAAFVKPDLEKLNTTWRQAANQVQAIYVKRHNQLTVFKYDETVYDTVGWKGDYWPFTLHIKDMMPMLSARVHLPPSAHTTFAANGFVVCTFLPRPLETDADALKVPFYHQNIDYDEVLFYHDGNFFSRDNLHAGMITLHPAGFPHGPHPKAIKGIGNKTHTDEVAVMIDTWQPLIVEESMSKVEVESYWKSWMSKD